MREAPGSERRTRAGWKRRRRWRRRGLGILSILCISRLGIEDTSAVMFLHQQRGSSPIFASFLISSRVGLRPSWASANARSQSLSSCLSFRACGSEDDGIVG